MSLGYHHFIPEGFTTSDYPDQSDVLVAQARESGWCERLARFAHERIVTPSAWLPSNARPLTHGRAEKRAEWSAIDFAEADRVEREAAQRAESRAQALASRPPMPETRAERRAREKEERVTAEWGVMTKSQQERLVNNPFAALLAKKIAEVQSCKTGC